MPKKLSTAHYRMRQADNARRKTSQFYDAFYATRIIDSGGACIDINDQIDFLPSCRQVTNDLYQIQRNTLKEAMFLLQQSFLITPFSISILEFIQIINSYFTPCIQSHYDFQIDSETQLEIMYQPELYPFSKTRSTSKTTLGFRQNSIFEKAIVGHHNYRQTKKSALQVLQTFRNYNQEGITLENILSEYLYCKYFRRPIAKGIHLVVETVAVTDQSMFLVEINSDEKLSIIPIDPQDYLPTHTIVRRKIRF